MGPPGCYGDQLAIILLKVSAWRGLAGLAHQNCSSLQYRSALVVARMRNIVFILLLRGLPQGKCPSEAVYSKMELTSSNDSKSLLFLISKSFGCFKYLKDSLKILGGQSSKILSFHQFL